MMDPKLCEPKLKTQNSNSNSTSGYGSQVDMGAPPTTKEVLKPPMYNNSVDSFNEYNTKYNPLPVAQPRLRRDRGILNSKRVQRRLIYKNGEVNVTQTNIKKRKQRYLADIFTTLVDIKWRWILLMFTLAFTLSWLSFGLIWWLICFSHGDFSHINDKTWKPCVVEVHDFVTALLFSIETQHTIGYGFRHTTSNCPEAIIVMMLQSCFGVIIQALMTGIVFAKLSRPKYRAETLLFSKNAVICQRDGQMCLLFRVGDLRKSHLVEAHVRAMMIKARTTREGEKICLSGHDVQLGQVDEFDFRLFLLWPTILEHRIDENSPFWEIGPEDLHKENFELIVTLEGIVESTGMTTQARTSYLPGEILWGHRFDKLEKRKTNGAFEVNYSRFHATIPVDTPQCSAHELSEMDLTETVSASSVNVTFDDNEEEDDDDDDEIEDDDNLSLSTQSSSKLKPLNTVISDGLPPTNHVINFQENDEYMDEEAYKYMVNQL